MVTKVTWGVVLLCVVLGMVGVGYYRRQIQVRATTDATAAMTTGCLAAPDARGVCRRNRLVNQRVTDYDSDVKDIVTSLVRRQAPADDPELVAVIRTLMDPPSEDQQKMSVALFQTPQAMVVWDHTKRKTPGFFVECGALDGERSSNSIWFEKEKKWSGLLVEVDPFYYSQIRGKNRRAYSINACLSSKNTPTTMRFHGHHHGSGKMESAKGLPVTGFHTTPCFPLESILLALGQTTVDYFSLDVEGMEMTVLKTIPFDRLDIRALSVEYVHEKEPQLLVDYMKDQGYDMVKKIDITNTKHFLFANDYIFVKK